MIITQSMALIQKKLSWEVEKTGSTPQKFINFYYQNPDGLKYLELAKASERRFNCTGFLVFHVKKMLLQMIRYHHKKTTSGELVNLWGGTNAFSFGCKGYLCEKTVLADNKVREEYSFELKHV